MELASQFREFIGEIRPTERQRNEWRAGSTALRDRLNSDPDLKGIVVATFLQGSVRRSTAVRPKADKRPDVDVVVVTTLDPATVTPDQAMKKFIPFLDKHYEGKWRPQDRSFGIELSYVDLDLVITALPADPQSRLLMESLYRSQAVLTTDTIEEAANWRLNDAWVADPRTLSEQAVMASLEDAPSSEWKPNPLLLPDRTTQTWGRTHPLAQIQWAAAKNRRCSGHYVNLVRALKWWRLEHAETLPKYPKGYPLEHMIGSVLRDGTPSMGQGVVQILESMRDTWAQYVNADQKPQLADHGVPEHDVLKRLTVDDFKKFHAAAAKAAVKAREALTSDDAQTSAGLWRELFGSRFPLPPAGGGDRPRGFTSPTGPAQPKTERFA